MVSTLAFLEVSMAIGWNVFMLVEQCFPRKVLPHLLAAPSVNAFECLLSVQQVNTCGVWSAVAHEQNGNNGPGTAGHQGRKPWVPSNGQNWGKKDLNPRVPFPPLANCYLCSSYCFPTFPPLACGQSLQVRLPQRKNEQGDGRIALWH